MRFHIQYHRIVRSRLCSFSSFNLRPYPPEEAVNSRVLRSLTRKTVSPHAIWHRLGAWLNRGIINTVCSPRFRAYSDHIESPTGTASSPSYLHISTHFTATRVNLTPSNNNLAATVVDKCSSRGCALDISSSLSSVEPRPARHWTLSLTQVFD